MVEVRRFEVINGAMGQRRWTADDRARIPEETLAPGAVVSAVARRNGLTPPQLFTWRREARRAAETFPAFVPAVVTREMAPASEPSATRSRPQRCYRQPRTAAIEVDVAGVRLTMEKGASPATIAAVFGALKAAS
ncbi:MAG: transposase [Rhizobiales bacterium 32-66-8]|nr:MAG: transposase [Rhizobiales bacterium 32-66-8]